MPLGAARDSFLALRRDLRAQRGGFAARFGRLALAALGEDARGDGESAAHITSVLRGRGIDMSAMPGKNDVDGAALWQARLVLELAAIVEEEEEVLRRQLAEIQEREQELFALLRGEAETHPRQTGYPRPAADAAGERMLRLRLRAWTRLYVAGDPLARQNDLPVTDRPEAWERLRDVARQHGGEEDVTLAVLPLPAAPEAAGVRDFLARVVAFRQEAAPLLARLEEALRPGGGGNGSLGATGLAAWSSALSHHFSHSGEDRLQLTLTRFSGGDPARLLVRAFDREDEESGAEEFLSRDSACCGLLEPVTSI